MLSISSYSNFTQKFISCLLNKKTEYSCYGEHLGLCISKIYLDLKLRYHKLYHLQVNAVSKMARGITCCWKSQLHHNVNFLLSHKFLKLYHHFVIIKKPQIIISYDGTCLFIATVYQVSEQKFILYCLHFDNTPDIISILILMFQLRILRGKQHLERKFKYTQKVWIQKFSKSKYKNQCLLEILMILINF